MVIIPQHIPNNITALEDSRLLLLFWNKDVKVTAIDSLLPKRKKKKKINIFPIHTPGVWEDWDRTNQFFFATPQWRHHCLKQQELLLVLRGIYTKNELIEFFQLVSSSWNSFEEFVLNNYKKVNTVKEFADYIVHRTILQQEIQTLF